MAIDTSAPRSRRAILAAAIGGLAATAAQALGRPAPAAATDGQPILQGVTNSGTASTVVAVASGTSLQGVTDAASGTAYGVRGRSLSTEGVGVVGQVTNVNGANYGVRGYSASPSGAGVLGTTTAVAFAPGVKGEATSPDGFGVVGTHGSGTGGGAGVYGLTSGTGGSGVVGYSTSNSRGVMGITGGATGRAVYAQATNASGANFGVEARVLSPQGVAVDATNLATSGPTAAIVGKVNSTTGRAVAGLAMTAGTGWAEGVGGWAKASSGIGVHGGADTTSPTAVGVLGEAQGGAGVHGWVGPAVAVPGAPAPKTGVYGRCDLDSGARGVSGYSTAGSGIHGASNTGNALYGTAGSSGTALRVNGKTVFSRSGKATIPTGVTSATVSGVTLTSYSLVLTTIQGGGQSGLYVRSVLLNVAGSSFQIKLSKATVGTVYVAWFVLN